MKSDEMEQVSAENLCVSTNKRKTLTREKLLLTVIYGRKIMLSGSVTGDWSFFQDRNAPGNGFSAVSCSVAGEKVPDSVLI